MESSSVVPGSSLVILSVSIVGILSTALLLLAYYLFLTRCGLLFFWRADQTTISVAVSVQEPPRRSAGLEEAAIRRIPTFRYGGKQLLPVPVATAATECAVCLADFRHGERLRLLPPCTHAFHIDCIDAWLQATASCPLCRAAVVEPADGIVAIDIASTAACPEAEQTPSSTNSLVLPMMPRRSLSMDSSTDRRFYLALQRLLLLHQQDSAASSQGQGQGDATVGGGKGCDAADRLPSSRRLRRSFLSLSHSQSILPL